MRLRVISGNLGGRQFDAPKGRRTHPMSEKIRGALFNMLGDITGLTVLDAFAGSGAVSFEAISRGAKNVVALDVDKNAHAIIKNNANSLGVSDKIKVIRANASGWSDNNQTDLFDVVVCDPPYDDVKPTLITKLSKHVKDRGLLILSLPPATEIKPLVGFENLDTKNYGDATLVFYRKTG